MESLPNVKVDMNTCDSQIPTFYELASAFHTDKVLHAPHHYEHAYQVSVAPRRCSAQSILEIGLGCNMGYGPGHSIPLWLNYFPAATVSMFEYNRHCVTTFVQQNPLNFSETDFSRINIFVGDQSSPADLLHAVKAAGPFDVIVDDGGHSMLQQIVSLSTLLPFVKPGGVYILEDLATSFWPQLSDLNISTVAFIGHMTSCLHTPSPPLPYFSDSRIVHACELAKLVESIACYEEVCVFTKWIEHDFKDAHSLV